MYLMDISECYKTIFMSNEVESYKLGKVRVVITETENPEKLHVDCNDGTYHSGFTVSRYEFKNYKRHMNQKITTAYRNQYEQEEPDSD
jgi:hypothetical protein